MSVAELNGTIFNIVCYPSYSQGFYYIFRYRITNIERKEVKYLGYGKR